ncbi:efflux RND transporter permease subunit [Kiritimatiella glycovorans]|uniref:Efflux transporter, putative, hydrophobe/amphiphile efflux-3 (HAE3) family n=1 Tax=Kiritimatiella glycovorans TaxID=1307763 RepID=A0A0G3EBB4_9BACT|nr:MMPL family transporter [Kiritimatiella glycovorans]AKJ63583.1 efflux transporter, putative, hydrophobe/amphiphile efflux-3 (HAE3) family [Kiritimatiella glycovorans]
MKNNPGGLIARFCTRHPRAVTLLMVKLALLLALLAALPTLWPEQFTGLAPLKVDTDPENMLPKDAEVRVYHDRMKETMSLNDMVVVGVVNEQDPDGVFNPDSLRRVYELTEYAKGLRWPAGDATNETVGVVPIDIIAPSTVDNIEQGEQPGVVRFEWLMQEPPATREEARAIRERAQDIPFLNGTLLSSDGKAVALYLPLTSKDMSSRVYDALQEKIATFDGPEQYHITGLPVAEDVFGVEMFKQMAISAPLAMLIIFLLMWFFFRKITLIISPMIVAVVCVIMTMGLLVATGNTVHIMSSMIPVFIMPIAVLDAVHILSEFFDRYQETRDRETTITRVMDSLFVPMLYTSITTAVGFGSLALVPIPPVQVFGIFVSFGVLMAWLWTITFIPAYIMFLKPSSLENFGAVHHGEQEHQGALSRVLRKTGRATFRYAKPVLAGVVVLSAVAVYGISQIRINDNPIRWFNRAHPIRVADRVLNEHFGGTYMAYLTLEPGEAAGTTADYAAGLQERLREKGASLKDIPQSEKVFEELARRASVGPEATQPRAQLLDRLEKHADEQLFGAPEAQMEAWDAALSFLAKERGRDQVFKQPEVLAFIDRLKAHLLDTGIVGEVNSLSTIVKTVYRELQSGREEDYRLPDSSGGVAQTLLQYQNSHRPQDLWHFVTPDYRTSVLWLQLRSGDNRDMEKVVHAVDAFMKEHDGPGSVRLRHRWFGLTHINVVWQDRMVSGMLQAFLGSFLIVFLMMTILYRSALWGLLSMVPLTVTIALIYGAIGLIGKDYDMPVAVLSALSLGLAVDYAIHFLSRSRAIYLEHGSWADTAGPVFGEPARAITRNAIVIGVGFLPLLAAPLVPYKTVGVFIAAILLTAGLASLLILPALITLLERLLFPRTRKSMMACHCGTCFVTSLAVLAVVVINLARFLKGGWTATTWVSLVIVLILAQACYWISRTERCTEEVPVPGHGGTEDDLKQSATNEEREP